MKYRKLGHSGLMVSEVALGTWLTFGRCLDDAAAKRLMGDALAAGINLIDTANTYEDGACEQALARCLNGVRRADYVMATKCFFPMSDKPNDRGLSRKHIFESAEASLQRLQTDYIDLFQCHRFDKETPLEETVQAMDDLCRQGKILYWGVSRWSPENISATAELCARTGWTMPISNQPCYNLLEREIEAEVIPASAQHGLSQIIYSPLAQGVLTGKYTPGAAAPADSRVDKGAEKTHIDRFLSDEKLEIAQKIAGLAQELDVQPAQLALAWCLRQDNIASVIIGASRPEQLAQNIRAGDVELGDETLSTLDQWTKGCV